MTIRDTQQTVRLADGKTPLTVEGETSMTFHRNGREFHMVALVVNQADTDVLCGMPFMTANDVAIRPARNEIIIAGDDIVTYNPVSSKPRTVKRLETFDVISRAKRVILPGQSWSVPLPDGHDEPVAIEPRYDTFHNHNIKDSKIWPPPQVITPVDGAISVTNHTDQPILLNQTEKVFKVLDTCEPLVEPVPVVSCDKPCFSKPKHDVKTGLYSTPVKLNPDKVLSPSTEVLFKDTLKEYDNVFNPKISRYNGYSGHCSVEVNMGSTKPPQRKGRVPMYSKSNLEELQRKFDDLEEKGVFVRPQELGVKVENVSPSFLVLKSSGDKRLVTDFTSLAPYIKPAPTLLPDVNATLLKMASWKYMIRLSLISLNHIFSYLLKDRLCDTVVL